MRDILKATPVGRGDPMASGGNYHLAQFHQFVGEQLETSLDRLSPEEALDLYRQGHPCPDDVENSVAAVEEALADMKAGDRGLPLTEYVREVRTRYGLPNPPDMAFAR
jgi:hypothetical protein